MKDERMTARERILHRLRERAHPATLPSPWRTRQHFDDPVAAFARAVEHVGGEVFVCATWEDVWDQVGGVLEEVGARRVVVNDEPPVNEVNWKARYPEIAWFLVGQDDGDLRAFCAQADVGISAAVAALVETGSVILESGPGRSRMATLLPPVHIAVVPRHLLTTDLFTWAAERQGAMPAAITIVTGPSKTADIEQTLAVGVHGPKRYVVLVGP